MDGQTLDSGILHWQPQASEYDKIQGRNEQEEILSDPQRFYLVAPINSTVLEIEAKHHLWVAAANRPAGLARKILIPEDAYPQADYQPMPSWFPIRPQGWREAQKNGKILLVAIQRRPVNDDDKTNSAGWVGHEPVTGSLGRYLLAPRDSLAPPLSTLKSGSGFINMPATKK